MIDQLQGFESPAGAWEPELFTARVRGYEPAWLDRLCHEGQVAWLRLSPRTRDVPDGPPGAPSKATPITVAFRDDLPWLLAAARGEDRPVEPTVGATSEVLATLRERGACFANELADATHRLPDDIARALWDGVARGLVTSDGFASIRARMSGRRRADEVRRFSRLVRGNQGGGGAPGRWSLVASSAPDLDAPRADREDLAEAVAEQLLNRWGIIFRDLAIHDSLRIPWRDVQWALRRLEDRGLVRGGRFVTGFTGEQYALPTAIEQLAHVRTQPRSDQRVTVNATDPLNLVGVIAPGPTVPSVGTRSVTYVDGAFADDPSLTPTRAAPGP